MSRRTQGVTLVMLFALLVAIGVPVSDLSPRWGSILMEAIGIVLLYWFLRLRATHRKKDS